MAKSRKPNETENYTTASLLDKPEEQVRLQDWTSTSEATNCSQIYENRHLLDLRVKLARLNDEISAFSEKRKNLTSSSFNSEERKQETQTESESVINIKVKPLSLSVKPKYSVKPLTKIRQADGTSYESQDEIRKTNEKNPSLKLKEHRKSKSYDEIKSQNLKDNKNVKKHCGARNFNLEPVKDVGIEQEKLLSSTPFSISSKLTPQTNFTLYREESDQSFFGDIDGSDRLDDSYLENILFQTKECKTKTVPIGNKTPILCLNDVLKLNPRSKKKFSSLESNIIENKNQTAFKEMESKNLISKSPQQPAIVQMKQNNSAKSKVSEKQSDSPLTSGAIKNVGKLITMTKDSDHGAPTKILNIADKKKVVILTMKKQESPALKSSPKKDGSKATSINDLETTKSKELPELKKYLTLNTNVANTCNDVKSTVVSTRKETKTSPVSNTLSPPTDRDSPRQGRRIRSPSIRYTDDMIVYPLKSPRKSKDAAKSGPNGNTASVDQDEKTVELKIRKSPKSARKDSNKDVSKVTVPCQTSHLYSLLTGKIKQSKAENSNENTKLDDVQETCENNESSSSQSSAVRALKFSEKAEKTKHAEKVNSEGYPRTNKSSEKSSGKSVKKSKMKVTQTVSKEEDDNSGMDKDVIGTEATTEVSNKCEKDNNDKVSSIQACAAGTSVKLDKKSPKKEKITTLPKESKSIKSPNKNTKKKNSEKTLQDKLISVGSLEMSDNDDIKTLKTRTSEVPLESAKHENDTVSETNNFVDLIGRDVIKVNSINTKPGDTNKSNVASGLFGLIAKLESSLTSVTELPAILTDAPYSDSIMLNEEEDSDQDSLDGDKDMMPKASSSGCDRNSPDTFLAKEASSTFENTENDFVNSLKVKDSTSDKIQNFLYDKPVASPDIILVDSATSSSREEISEDKKSSGKNECDLSNSEIIEKSGVSEVNICPPDSTTNVSISGVENNNEILEENKDKGFSSDTEDNKSGGENVGSRNLFDDFLSNIASPVKDGQKKEEKVEKDDVNTNNDEIMIKDDDENKTAEEEKNDDSVDEDQSKTIGRNDKNSELKHSYDSKTGEEEDVIIVKVEQKKELENESKNTVKEDGMNKSSVTEQIKKKFLTEQEETSRKTLVKEEIVYDLTLEESNSSNTQKDNMDSSIRSLKSSVIRKRKSVQKVTSPAPLDVLMRVEMETTNSLSAFTSKNLDEYLNSLNSDKVSSIEVETGENAQEETDDTEMELLPEFDPDFDEVDGLLFMSFTSEDALNAHVHVERKTNIGKNENLLLGMSRIKRLRQQQRQIPSRFQTKFNKLKKLKIQSKINQNLRGMHKALSKYQRLYRLQLEKVFTEKGLQLPVRPVKTLQKTSDITKIKGWKNKYGNTEELAEATGLPLTKSGKIHWRTEERLLKNLNSQELKEIGLNLKKKRRKNLIFTVRKGMSKGDRTMSKTASSKHYDDYDEDNDESEEEEECQPGIKIDVEDMNDDYWFPKNEDDKNKKSEVKINLSKQRLAIKRLNIDPEDVEIIKKLGGSKAKMETMKETGLGTYLSPSGRVVKRRRKRRKIIHLTTMTHSMALAALKALDPKFVKPKSEPTKTPSAGVKKESTKKSDNNTSGEATLKPCDKPGCRYGCICHLCRLGDQSSDPEASGKSRPPSCDKEYCRLGCICDSIEKRERQRLSSHCGKPECMFQCVCDSTDDLKKKLFSPNNSHSDINDSVLALDHGSEDAIPSLSSNDNSFDDMSEERKSRRQDSKVANVPKRTPTYRLAKNLDAISRKAMLLYETSEMYTEMKARKRKSRDSSQEGYFPPNKPASNGGTPTSKTNQLKTSFTSNSGKKGPVWRSSFQPCPASSTSPSQNGKTETLGSEHSYEVESDDEEIKEYTGTSARTIGYNPLTRKSTKKCTCSCSETHGHEHNNHKTKTHSSGEATSPVVISPVNSRPSTPEGSSASQIVKERDKQSVTEKKYPVQVHTDHVTSSDIKVPVPKPQTIWHTQWVCLKANKKKLEEEGQSASDGVRLLEINSNCNWEVSKQKILSRISTQLYKEGYPSPQRIMVGDFCIEFLQKSNKPAVIPPEVRAKLPVSIYSVRINIMKINNISEQQNPELNIHTVQHIIPTQEQILKNTSVASSASSVTSAPAVTSSSSSPFKPFRISNRTKIPVKVQIAHTNEQNTVSTSEKEKTSPLGIPSGGISGFSQLQIKNAGQHKSLASSLPLATQSFILNSGNPSEGLILSKTNGTLGMINKQQNVDPKIDDKKLPAKAMYVGSITVSNTSITHSITDCTSVSQTVSQSVLLSPQMSASTFVVSSTGLKSSPDTGATLIQQSQEDKTKTSVTVHPSTGLSSTGLNISSGGVNIGLSNTTPNIVNTSGFSIGPRPSIGSSGVFIGPSTTGANINSGVNIGPTNTGLILSSSGVNVGPINTGINNSGSVNIGSSVSGVNVNSSFKANTGSNNPVIFKDTKLSNPRIEGLRQGLQNILKCNVAQETQKVVQILPDKDKVIGPVSLTPNMETNPSVTGAVGTLPVTIYGPFDSPMSLPVSSNVKFLKAAPVKAGSTPVFHLLPISGSQKFATHLVVSQSSPLSTVTRMPSSTSMMTRPLLTTSSLPAQSVATPPASRELIAVPVNLTQMSMQQTTSHGQPFMPVSQAKNPQSITIPFKGQISILPKVQVNLSSSSVPKVPISRTSTPSSLNDISASNLDQSESVSSKPETEKKKKRKKQENNGNDEKTNTEEGKKKKRVKKDSDGNTKKKNKSKKKEGNSETNDLPDRKKKRKKKKNVNSEKRDNEKDINASNEKTNEVNSCETDIKNSSEIVQREAIPSEGSQILYKTDNDMEPPLKRQKSVNELIESEKKDISSCEDNKKDFVDESNNASKSVGKTESLEMLIDKTLHSECEKKNEGDIISKDDKKTHGDEIVASDIDEIEMNDEVDSMKSSGGSSLAGKNLLHSVEIGAEEIRSIVQNVNCNEKQEIQNVESNNGNLLNSKDTAPHFLKSFMEQDNSNSSCFQSDLGEVTEGKAHNEISALTSKSGTEKGKSVENIKNEASEVIKETLSPTKMTESCEEDLNSDGVLIIDTSISDDNMETPKITNKDLQYSTNNTDNDSAKYDIVKIKDKSSANNDYIKNGADHKNSNVNNGNKRNITDKYKEKITPVETAAGKICLNDNWKEVGDLGAVINITEEGLIAIDNNKINDLRMKDIQSTSTYSGLKYKSGLLNRDYDECSDDVEIISFDDDIENTTKQNMTVNSTENRKRKSSHIIREELPAYKIIKQRDHSDTRIDSPGLSVDDSDEDVKDLQSEPSARGSIIDDCDENDVDDDEDIDIESAIDTDSVYKQLQAQARDQSSTHNTSKHSCMLHSTQMKRKRKPQLEVIHNSLHDDVEYKEGNIWIPIDPKTKVDHSHKERQRRCELADLFKKICKILFDEAELTEKEVPKIQILTKLKELIASSEKIYKRNLMEKKYYTNKNTALKLRLNNLKVSLRNDGVSEAIIQGHLQKVAYIVSKMIKERMHKVQAKESELPAKSLIQPGNMEVPIRLIPIQSSDRPNVKISNFQNTSQIKKINCGSIIKPSPSSASYSSPVPVQMVSSQQVKQMAAAIHINQETSASSSDKDPDIYIDYAEEGYQEGVDETATDFHLEENKLPDIGDLPELVYGSEKLVSNIDDNSDTNNQTLQNDSSYERKNQLSDVGYEKVEGDLKLTSMLIESTGEIIRVELRDDGQTSEQTDDEEQTNSKMYDREEDDCVHVESFSDPQNVSELLAGSDT